VSITLIGEEHQKIHGKIIGKGGEVCDLTKVLHATYDVLKECICFHSDKRYESRKTQVTP